MYRDLRVLLLLLLLPLAVALSGCPPTLPPGPNPPAVSWAVSDQYTKQVQTFSPNGVVHLTQGTFTLSFLDADYSRFSSMPS